MVSRTVKRKRSELYWQHLDWRVALSILSIFSLLVSIYLIANCSRLISSLSVLVDEPASSFTGSQDLPTLDPEMQKFASQDDFESYIDDGKRLYGDGLFEAQSQSALISAGRAAVAVSEKAVIKKAGDAKAQAIAANIDPETAQRYFSLKGSVDPTVPEMAQLNADKIYFSPENQYYPGPDEILNNDISSGQILELSILPDGSLTQSETIPLGGNIILADGRLVAFSGNTIIAYNADSSFGRREIWRSRINEGSKILGSKLIKDKLYLVIETKIDMANPCPIKPITANGQAFLIKCSDIYHSKNPIPADSLITIAQVLPGDGKVDKTLSFTVQSLGVATIFSDDSIYSAWSEGGDYASFFSRFLSEKCKGLFPNYIIEKAAKLGGYNISLLAKEIELRSMLMNWLVTLNEDEQKRIAQEVSSRMQDYLSGDYNAFEETHLARIKLDSLDFSNSVKIPGFIYDPGFINIDKGNIRVLTISGKDSLDKANWLVSGEIATGAEAAANNIYVLDKKLDIIGSSANMSIPQPICAVRFSNDIAYASLCAGDMIYLINLDLAEGVGLASELDVLNNDFFVYPLDNRQLLIVSKDGRNIKLMLFDNILAANPEKKSEYSLDDYWADFDVAYSAFAADESNNLFFLPTGRGGYIFFYKNGKIELQKKVGDNSASRVFLAGGKLNIISNNGLEFFGAPEWSKTSEIKFINN